MLSPSLQLTIIPCGKQEPFRGEPASCSALNLGMLILPNIRGQGEVPSLPTLMDNLSCHSNTPPDYFGQLTQEGIIPPVLLDQVAQTRPISNIWSSVKMAHAALLDTLWPPTPHTSKSPAEEPPQHSQGTTQHHQIQILIHLNQWMLDLSPKPFILKATWTFSLKA